MAIYCELPGERLCDIGWERLFCTKEWLEEQIREIRGYSREQRIQLGRECMKDILTCLVNSCSDKKLVTAIGAVLYSSAVGIACLNRSSATQPWKCEVAEMFDTSPEKLENMIEQFKNGKQFSYQTVVTCMTTFGAHVDRPVGSRYLQLCICTACADTPNEAAFDWIRKIFPEYLMLLERWDYALRMSAIAGDDSEISVVDDYRDEKTILPLREYRRQQRAAERKARPSKAELRKEYAEARMLISRKRVEEKHQPIQDAQDEYGPVLENWKKQCVEMQQKQECAFAQQVAREMAALKDAAKQRCDQVVRENDRIISEQQKRQTEAAATLAVLGTLKLAEKIQQKRVIREAEKAISSAMAAKEAAQEACAREQREAEEQIAKAEPRIRAEVARAYPIPRKPDIPAESLQLLEYQQFAAYLRDLTHGGPWRLSEIMDQISPEIRALSIFGSPNESLSVETLATVMGRLTGLGLAEKTTIKRRTCYTVI